MAVLEARRYPVYVNFLVRARASSPAFRRALDKFSLTAMISPVVLLGNEQVSPDRLGDEIPVASRDKGAVRFAEDETSVTIDDETTGGVVSRAGGIGLETGKVSFTGGVPWAHIDLSASDTREDTPLAKKGHTGAGTGTLIEYLLGF